MVSNRKKIDRPDLVEKWLESTVRPALRPDVSNYAKGRLRCWLNNEPTLSSPTRILPGFEVRDEIISRLAELIEWDFDFCLVTYSGDETPIGISPHRDAAFANFDAMSLNVSGECRFDYWEDRGASKKTGPSHSLILTPGDVTAFNCKHLHAATPGPKRWNLNFWRAKPPKA